VNPVRYPLSAEQTDVIQALPAGKRGAKLARLRAALAEHLAKRPHWSDINALSAWVNQRDLLQLDIQILESQTTNTWKPVESQS